MFDHYNDETELLSLMLNKDEFLRYITQHYKNNCCTLLEPLIWAIHFNISKYQRLPLLENILLQSVKHIRINYSFLPEKQILGKAYEVLGIPTVCGEPDKCFLNAYKKYKFYYPVRYPKKMKTCALNNVNVSTNRSIMDPNYSHRSNTPIQMNQEIISSTPITEKIPSLMINPLLSPINIPMNDEYSILWTDSFFKKDYVLNTQNSNDSTQISFTKTLGTLSMNNNNLSHQKLENIDNAEMEYSNNTQNQMYFISRDPKYVQAENESLQSDENNLSYMRNKEHLKNETKDNDNSITSEYFNDMNKKKYKNRITKNQNLSEKLEKNLKKHLKKNFSITKSMKSPLISIKTPKLIKCINTTKKSYSESSANESWTRIKQAFTNHSFSDLDKTAQTPITKKSSLWMNKYYNTVKQNSMKLNYSNTQEENKNNFTDKESQNYNNWENSEFSNTQEENKNNFTDKESQNYNNWENSEFSENSLEKSNIVQKLNAEESNKYNVSSTSHMNSQIFSEDSFSLFNSSNSSQQLDSIKQEFMISSVDSCDNNNYL